MKTNRNKLIDIQKKLGAKRTKSACTVYNILATSDAINRICFITVFLNIYIYIYIYIYITVVDLGTVLNLFCQTLIILLKYTKCRC